MLIVGIRTDRPEAELGLFEASTRLDSLTWPAHRELAETIHLRLKDLLGKHGKAFADINGLVFYEGPGSFTGLRIGASVANALAESLHIPIVGATGDDWAPDGVTRLLAGEHVAIVLPDYGAAPHITVPRK